MTCPLQLLRVQKSYPYIKTVKEAICVLRSERERSEGNARALLPATGNPEYGAVAFGGPGAPQSSAHV